MTVHQLIERLQRYPPMGEVRMEVTSGPCDDIYHVEVESVSFNDEEKAVIIR